MKTKNLSKKLSLNKATIQNLNNESMDYIRAGYVKDSIQICTIAGTDCYCYTRPPVCTNAVKLCLAIPV